MDTTWTNVRQVVADRVLDRHLRDLEDQEVAMGMTKHHMRHGLLDRDFAGVQRSKATDFPVPTTRLHAIPKAPSGHGRPAKHHVPVPPPQPQHQPHTHKPPPTKTSPTEVERPPSRDGCRILDMMADALQSASLMEQQRPSLYLKGIEGALIPASKGAPIKGTLKLQHPKPPTVIASQSHESGKKVSPTGELRGPYLDREKTFIKPDKPQGKTVSQDKSDEKQAKFASGQGDCGKSPGRSDQFPRPTTSIKSASKARRSSLSSQHELHNRSEIPQPRRRSLHVAIPSEHSETAQAPQRRASIHVEFYDENELGFNTNNKIGGDGFDIDTGLRKEDGGFTPHHLSLPLHLLRDGSSDDNSDNKDGGGDAGRQADVERKEEGEEEGEAWDKAKKCRYIRGYDPPEMQIPQDSVKFVFGDKDDGAACSRAAQMS